MTPQVNYAEVNAGWSMFPVAYLPGQSTFEMNVTSGKFEADLFSMTNATNFAENTEYEAPLTERLTVAEGLKVTLANVPVAKSVSISGMTEGDAAAAGVFAVAADDKTVTFAEGDVAVGDEIMVSYMFLQTVQEANIDNKSSAIGEAIMVYPVYGSGDDCTESAIIGKVYLKVYRARITGQPGLDGSYKSASTFQFTLSAMDAKRADEAVYSIAYVRE